MHHLSNDTLIDFIHGELPAADDAATHAHLGSCSACRAEYEREIAFGEYVRAAAAAEERELPAMVRANVWERVRAERPSPLAAFAAWWRPAFALPLAAVVVAGAFFASPLDPLASRPTISATFYLQAHAAQTQQSPFSEPANVASAMETSLLDGAGSSPASLADAVDAGDAGSTLATISGVVDAVR